MDYASCEWSLAVSVSSGASAWSMSAHLMSSVTDCELTCMEERMSGKELKLSVV